jgi:hypothetical protein
MSDIANALRDPLWQFVGVIVAIVSIAIVIFFSIRQRNRKALSFKIISSTPVLSVSEGVQGKLRILYEDKEVQEVQLVVISMTNSGNLPIIENDYSQPIEVSFGDGKLLTVELMEVTPKDLDVVATIKNEKVVLNKALLNQGDSFIIRALIADFKNIINVKGRIVGVKEIAKQVEPRNLRNAALGVGIMYFGLFSAAITTSTFHNGLLSGLSIVIIVAGTFVTLWYMGRQFLLRMKVGKKKK